MRGKNENERFMGGRSESVYGKASVWGRTKVFGGRV